MLTPTSSDIFQYSEMEIIPVKPQRNIHIKAIF